MSRIWAGLRNGLKFSCTACGRCCNNKRSNVSLNLSEVKIESMSLFVGMDKHTFLEKYTEETESDGVYFTKLKHKKDLSCIMLDIDGKECTVHGARPTQCRSYPFLAENVIGEAEWRSESKKCEGIIIDGFFKNTLSTDSVPHSGTTITTADRGLLSREENFAKSVLYDGVVTEFENTYHGNENNYLKNNIDRVTDQTNANTKVSGPAHSNTISQENSKKFIGSDCEIVHPDTIIRQMILHEIHGDGLGPDWGYQDSLELLLESEQNSLESSSGNVLEDFKVEFYENNYSSIIFEDDFLRVVDTTTPIPAQSELLLNIEKWEENKSCEEDRNENILKSAEYSYDLMDFRSLLGLPEVNIPEEHSDLLSSEAEIENVETVTKRRFEFLNSCSLTQTEMYVKISNSNLDDPKGLGSEINFHKLIMPIHQVASLICQKAITDVNKRRSGMLANAKDEDNRVNITVLGAGGFALPSHLLALYPTLPDGLNLVVHSVDPERRVIDAAKSYFGAAFTEHSAMSTSTSEHSAYGETKVRAYVTDGLTYLQERYKSDPKNCQSHVLFIDAFEETPTEGYGPGGLFVNRAPPISLLSDMDLVENSLAFNYTTVEGNLDGDNTGNSLSSVSQNGGILAINIFGPTEWVDKVFNLVSSRPGFSPPLIVRIKNQKNVLLISSRTSTEKI